MGIDFRENFETIARRNTMLPLPGGRWTIAFCGRDGFMVGCHGEYDTYGSAAYDLHTPNREREMLFAMGYNETRINEIVLYGHAVIYPIDARGRVVAP